MDRVTITSEEKAIADAIFEAAKEVFDQLGPGLLESVYEMCLEHELKLRGYSVEHQVPLSIKYKDLEMDNQFRIDLWVNRKVVIELKAVSEMKDIFKAQLNTYLKLSGCNLGILINFNVRYIGEGFTRWIVRK